MKIWSIYVIATGVFTGRSYIGPSLETLGPLPEGEAAWLGQVDATRWRLDTSGPEPVLVEYRPPPPPDTDMVTWRWSEPEWRWEPHATPAAQAQAVCARRAELLAACDWVVTRAAEQGATVPMPWQTYRQALRDITLQQGFPSFVAWPAPPA
ncbi:phage tail assembly chaperone [Ideonella paludis]|uniref:Phage tail assembly chaperone-like domain-containing protein n=1 Tax=Ideonella paludis TaxID=1233411 RepID=A0ABS5DU41_9BURK|nr:phage tail assembly chaperone [Ideonella paludis]MBQ0934658.1 hypothetical protein [Ideonella paludis]